MAIVYVGPRPNGRPEGSSIQDYVVETAGAVVLNWTSTQADAVAWAKRNGHTPRVARVRHLNDKRRPDHWRAI